MFNESSNPSQSGPNAGGPLDTTERRIFALKRRLIREATLAISMLEAALAALWTLDAEAARAVRLSDDNIDLEEVQIEQQAYELLALHHPFGRDFRVLVFILKVNAELERTADHASGIAKQVAKIRDALPDGAPPQWPTALRELAERVPALCHELMRAVLDENIDAARRLVAADSIIDQLEKRLFEETQDYIRSRGGSDAAITVGMLIYRIGRELERVGDLMAGVAEDVVYVATGEIIRHEKRRIRKTA
ncbi:MAG: hypothetical protein JNK25_12665 [Phycisphaerae bacterium]|nr:hypothetical protein [Phycisphaerae bacterium]